MPQGAGTAGGTSPTIIEKPFLPASSSWLFFRGWAHHLHYTIHSWTWWSSRSLIPWGVQDGHLHWGYALNKCHSKKEAGFTDYQGTVNSVLSKNQDVFFTILITRDAALVEPSLFQQTGTPLVHSRIHQVPCEKDQSFQSGQSLPWDTTWSDADGTSFRWHLHLSFFCLWQQKDFLLSKRISSHLNPQKNWGLKDRSCQAGVLSSSCLPPPEPPVQRLKCLQWLCL